jgi:hypothetical protein
LPAKSKKQQRFFGMVHGLQKGTTDPKDVSKKVRKVARSIDPDDAKKFAKTKHKGLPMRVKKEVVQRAILRYVIREEIRSILERETVSKHQKSPILKPGEINNVERAKQFLQKLTGSGMNLDDIARYLANHRGYLKVYGFKNLTQALGSMRF